MSLGARRQQNDYELDGVGWLNYSLVGRDAVQSGRYLPTFRKNFHPPTSGLKFTSTVKIEIVGEGFLHARPTINLEDHSFSPCRVDWGDKECIQNFDGEYLGGQYFCSP